MFDYLSALSAAQQEAVFHKDGPMLVLAGPGSGKTRVITCRIHQLIQQHKVSPDEILVVTFTKAAAREMKERFLKLGGTTQTQVTFGTFHAVFFSVLKYAYGFRADQIVRQEQQYEYLRDMVRKLRLDIEDEGEFFTDLLGEISRVKNERPDLSSYHAFSCDTEAFVKIYDNYEQRLKRARLIDFDDMMVYCHDLFVERVDILEAWRRKYRYILIDEFQDINGLQYEIIKMMAAPRNNLFVVGDDDQAIYGFRGSKPELMLQFPLDYTGSKQVILNTNYRSTSEIVKYSQMLIMQNEKRYKKQLNACKKDGPPVVAHVFGNQEDQFDCMIDKMRLYREHGGRYQDMAVLFRTNLQASALIEKLMERNVPFRIRDRLPNIYEHWIAKHIFAYIRIAMGSRKRLDFLQIMNRPKRYLSRDVLEQEEICLEELYRLYDDKPWVIQRLEKLEYDLSMIAKMKPFGAIHYIRHIVGYEEYLKEYAQYRGIKADEYFEVYETIQEQARKFQSFEEWFSHIEAYQEALEKQAAENREAEGVILSTMHSSKGLEYRIVFLPDVNEGMIPYKKAVLREEIEEERRLFYVAMTRAKELLYLFAAKERHGKRLAVSRFFKEAGGDLLMAKESCQDQ